MALRKRIANKARALKFMSVILNLNRLMNCSVVKRGMKTTGFRMQVDEVFRAIERQNQWERRCPPDAQQVQDHPDDSDVFLVASNWNAVVEAAAS